MSTMKSVLVVAASLLAVPSAVYACSCAVMAADDARRVAAMVFEGTVERIEPIPNSSSARATFRVVRVWKGDVERQVTLSVPAQPSMCPPHFAEGQSYVVYAEASDAGFRVGACARYAAGDGLRRERSELGSPVRTYRRHVPPPG